MPVPAGFWDFVAEYDLAPALPRFLTEEQADRALERADSPLTHLDLRPQRPCHVCGEMAHEAEPGRWICHCGDWGQVA